jgi:dipeptidase
MKKFYLKIFSKRVLFLSLFFLMSGALVISMQSTEEKPFDIDGFESCTSIMVGKKATTDGSVITAHSCDGSFRTWLNIEPHKTHKEGSKNKIYFGLLHNETRWDQRGVTLAGEIPQVKETYAFLNTAYPCMNEKQLAIGETTIGGRRELRNTEGVFLIEELERIMLERCTTAREAIKLAGQLVKEHGYCDNGECITVADPKEVWHFEIFGAGPLEIGAVWAAVRIPDDHVGVSANIPRIAELDLDNPDYYMASENVYSLAEEMGWWDPNSGETFKFWKAYSGRRPFSTREFFVLSTVAPSLNLTMEMKELPFSVKAEKKLSVRDVFAYYRQTYAGTDMDMTKDLMVKTRKGELVKSPIANPWMTRDLMNLINTLKPGTIRRQRTIAISNCSYSEVLQCRDWLPDPVGGIAWFSFDNPGQSPRIPIFAGVTELPKSFEIGAWHRFRMDSACWAFRRTNRLLAIRWGETKEIIEGAVKGFEDKAFDDLPNIEKKAEELYKSDPKKLIAYITKYTNDFARAAMHKYLEMHDDFWTRYKYGF